MFIPTICSSCPRQTPSTTIVMTQGQTQLCLFTHHPHQSFSNYVRPYLCLNSLLQFCFLSLMLLMGLSKCCLHQACPLTWCVLFKQHKPVMTCNTQRGNHEHVAGKAVQFHQALSKQVPLHHQHNYSKLFWHKVLTIGLATRKSPSCCLQQVTLSHDQ